MLRDFQTNSDAAAFSRLNREWIERLFTLEARDIESLDNPEGAVLAKGGSIMVAELHGSTIGCVALVPMPDRVYELSKMAVAQEHRGKGIGRQLLLHAIAYARTLGATSLFLGSNMKLPDAIHLYESVGFKHLAAQEIPPLGYSRANVFMSLQLQ